MKKCFFFHGRLLISLPNCAGQASFLGQKQDIKMSSACTGAYTAEMATAVTLRIVNQSERLGHKVGMQSVACWETWMAYNGLLFFFYETCCCRGLLSLATLTS